MSTCIVTVFQNLVEPESCVGLEGGPQDHHCTHCVTTGQSELPAEQSKEDFAMSASHVWDARERHHDRERAFIIHPRQSSSTGSCTTTQYTALEMKYEIPEPLRPSAEKYAKLERPL